MRYGIICVKTLHEKNKSGKVNIGDYIQNVAARQFYPKVDEYYDREAPDTGTQPVKMIMNAWYMAFPEYFPPSNRVDPLLVSIHITPNATKKMLLGKGLDWLKQHQPIGCRDKYTESLLRSKGIDAYFSGCLTLTLGYKYKTNSRGGGILRRSLHCEYTKGRNNFI